MADVRGRSVTLDQLMQCHMGVKHTGNWSFTLECTILLERSQRFEKNTGGEKKIISLAGEKDSGHCILMVHESITPLFPWFPDRKQVTQHFHSFKVPKGFRILTLLLLLLHAFFWGGKVQMVIVIVIVDLYRGIQT